MPICAQDILDATAKVEQIFHRLVLVVGPLNSGKSKAVLEIAERIKARVINVNYEVSRQLLDVTIDQRGMQVLSILRELDAVSLLYTNGPGCSDTDLAGEVGQTLLFY